MRKLLVAALACAGLAGCSPGKDLGVVDKSIEQFHRDLDAGNFERLYAEASPLLKKAAARDRFVPLLEAIHRKLGPYQSGQRQTWQDTVNTSGHFVNISFAAKYAKGGAEESFVYKIENSGPQLAGYHVNSDALITN